jgi:hypothetical protein
MQRPPGARALPHNRPIVMTRWAVVLGVLPWSPAVVRLLGWW